MATKDFDLVRWRSFAERYIVERARTFEVGRERDGIFLETQNALMAYQHIYNVGMVQEGKMPSTASVLAGAGPPPNPPGTAAERETLMERVRRSVGQLRA